MPFISLNPWSSSKKIVFRPFCRICSYDTTKYSNHATYKVDVPPKRPSRRGGETRRLLCHSPCRENPSNVPNELNYDLPLHPSPTHTPSQGFDSQVPSSPSRNRPPLEAQLSFVRIEQGPSSNSRGRQQTPVSGGGEVQTLQSVPSPW